MLHVFDTVLTSSDLSIDRVLIAGLPVAAIFYKGELPGNLRAAMDGLAEKYAGKILVVMLANRDAEASVRRFNIRQFPTLVAFREGKPLSRQENLTAENARAQLAYLAGEGPMPSVDTPIENPGRSRKQTAGPMEVNEAEFEQEVLRAERPVLIDFWASWCGPCRMMEPALDRLAHERGEVLKVVKVNVDENPGISSRYGVMGIPTMLVMQNGQEADRLVGALPEAALRNRLARWLQVK
jgi:thioredoxin 1